MAEGIQHGTSAYAHAKCRCEVCRAAVAEYQRKRKKAQRDGTWNPMRGRAPVNPSDCSVSDCGLPARYKTPVPLCGGHWQQQWRGVEFSPLTKKHRVADGMKECSRCGVVKVLAEFNKQYERPAAQCKSCQAIYSRARKYGLSFEATQELMSAPCAGCLASPDVTKDLHIDHCHETGRVRGVLCRNCNTVLTKHMTPEILRRLADYLE